MTDASHREHEEPLQGRPREDTRPSTRWSVIVRAQGDGADARRALDELIRRYDHTVLTMFRARRRPWNAEPEDLKQAFFARMIQHQDLRKLDPSRGRFRDWLYVSVRHFAWNVFDKLASQGRLQAALQKRSANEEIQVRHGCTPEQLFMRQFAEDTLLRAIERHRAQARDPVQFERMLRFLPGPTMDAADISALAAAWGIPSNTLVVRRCDLVKKHKAILRGLVADTLDVDPNDPNSAAAIDAEMSELFRLLNDVPRPDIMLEHA